MTKFDLFGEWNNLIQHNRYAQRAVGIFAYSSYVEKQL